MRETWDFSMPLAEAMTTQRAVRFALDRSLPFLEGFDLFHTSLGRRHSGPPRPP